MTTLEILKACVVDDNDVVRLPQIDLERPAYVDVKNALEKIGGKWKGGKIGGFVFADCPRELLGQVANGVKRNIKKEFQFYGTPADLVQKLMDLIPYAGNISRSPSPTVLEPSAGDGAIIKAIRTNYGCDTVDCGIIDCYELMPANRAKLAQIKGVNILGEDFLTCDKTEHYDLIIANPPFSKNQDTTHFQKMYEVCKPGGHIICIMSIGWMYSTAGPAKKFRNWLDNAGAFNEQQWHQFGQIGIDQGFTRSGGDMIVLEMLPDDAFKESGANVRTVIVSLTKTLSAAKQRPSPKGKPPAAITNQPEPELEEPAVILQKLIDGNKSINQSLQNMRSLLNHQTIEDMNFFQNFLPFLAGTKKVTFTIQKKGDQLTIGVLPELEDDEDVNEKIKLLAMTGTAAEVDEGFFQKVEEQMKAVAVSAGLTSNIEEVKEGLKEEEEKPKAKAKTKAKPAQKPVKKANDKKAAPTKAKPADKQEPEQPKEETPEETSHTF